MLGLNHIQSSGSHENRFASAVRPPRPKEDKEPLEEEKD